MTRLPHALPTVALLRSTHASRTQLNHIFGGSCEINPANYLEFYGSSIMLIFGSSVWAYVIGSCCGIIATIDPALLEHRTMMDELNFFARDQDMPEQLTVRLRAYFRQTLDQLRAERYERLLGRMSTRLRGDTSYRMASRHVRQVPYLSVQSIEPEFLCHIAVRMRVSVYSKLERVMCTRLFIITRGVACKRGVLGLAGFALGKDFVVSNPNLRDLADAIALTFLQGTSLTTAELYDILPSFPIAYKSVRGYAFRVALTRALVKAAELKRKGAARGEFQTLNDALQSTVATPAAPRVRFQPHEGEDEDGGQRWTTKLLASFKSKKPAHRDSGNATCAGSGSRSSPSGKKRPGLMRSATTKIFANESDSSAQRDFSRAFSVPNNNNNVIDRMPELPNLNDRIKSLETLVAGFARSSQGARGVAPPSPSLETKVDDMQQQLQTLIAKVGDLTQQVKAPPGRVHGRALQKLRRTRPQNPAQGSRQEASEAAKATAKVAGMASEDKDEMLEEGAVAETRSSPFDA